MILSKKWVKDYVDFNATDKEFADEMTLSKALEGRTEL